MNAQIPVLEVRDLVKHYSVGGSFFGRGRKRLRAVDGVSFSIGHGETLGLVGESGCGKSTVGKAVLRLVEPTSGHVSLEGEEITGIGSAALLDRRKRMQVIFQDPYSSLNPRMTAGEIVQEPLINFGIGSRAEQRDRVALLFARVGLRPDQRANYPHEFSGGQRQRLGIARALALGPSVIIGDEPVSALDVSVQAQVINLMMELQQEFGLSYLFVAHDLGVVEHISHRVAVMYLGKIVEIAARAALFETPKHPYTEALLAAVPVSHPRARRARTVLTGDVPSPINPPPGCRFHTRCPIAVARCRQEEPPLVVDASGHGVACHLRAATA
ncbi:MAG: ABC transporter ATP-binding protein [Alphaproteobacteria bacterium]|jgi:oligopeptide/dipeptide ABC transporter ATP-binding protein